MICVCCGYFAVSSRELYTFFDRVDTFPIQTTILQHAKLYGENIHGGKPEHVIDAESMKYTYIVYMYHCMFVVFSLSDFNEICIV